MVSTLETSVEERLAAAVGAGAQPTTEQIDAQLDLIASSRLDTVSWLRSIATEPRGEIAFAMAVAGMVGGIVLTPYLAIPAAIELSRQVYLESRRDR